MGTILGDGTVQELREKHPGRGDHPGRRRLRRGSCRLERDDRQAPGAYRPLLRRRGRHGGGRVRPQPGARARRSWWGPQPPRVLHYRRRHRHRPVSDEGDPGGPGAQRVVAKAGRHVARARPRDAGVRAGGDRGAHLVDRHRRLHARRRDRLADAQVRPEPATTSWRPTSSRRTVGSCAPASTRTRSCSGASAAGVGTSGS